jgi:hypothetical protein
MSVSRELVYGIDTLENVPVHLVERRVGLPAVKPPDKVAVHIHNLFPRQAISGEKLGLG